MLFSKAVVLSFNHLVMNSGCLIDSFDSSYADIILKMANYRTVAKEVTRIYQSQDGKARIL